MQIFKMFEGVNVDSISRQVNDFMNENNLIIQSQQTAVEEHSSLHRTYIYVSIVFWDGK